jgi:hypothetical protein
MKSIGRYKAEVMKYFGGNYDVRQVDDPEEMHSIERDLAMYSEYLIDFRDGKKRAESFTFEQKFGYLIYIAGDGEECYKATMKHNGGGK